MKTNLEFKKFLLENDACAPAMEWLGDRTPEQCYNESPRADWLLWWFNEAHKKNLPGYPTIDQLKKCAIEIARKVKHLVKDYLINEVFNLLDEYLETGIAESAYTAVAYATCVVDRATENAARDKTQLECADLVRSICTLTFH